MRIEVSPPRPSPETIGKLRGKEKTNNIISWFTLEQIRNVMHRKDATSLSSRGRSQLTALRGIAYEGYYPGEEELQPLTQAIAGKQGGIFEGTREMIESVDTFRQHQEKYWEQFELSGDSLRQHQNENVVRLLTKEHGGAILVFGSARTGPGRPEFQSARWLTRTILDGTATEDGNAERVITGAGPGVMQGANMGAMEAAASIYARMKSNGQSEEALAKFRSDIHSFGIRINLKFETGWNPFLQMNLTMKNFNVRKTALVGIASGRSMDHKEAHEHENGKHPAVFVYPGGIGTLDEAAEVLCLIQCKKMPRIPVCVVGQENCRLFRHAMSMYVDNGYINPEDTQLITYCRNEQEALHAYCDFYGLPITASMRLALDQDPILAQSPWSSAKRIVTGAVSDLWSLFATERSKKRT